MAALWAELSSLRPRRAVSRTPPDWTGDAGQSGGSAEPLADRMRQVTLSGFELAHAGGQIRTEEFPRS